jgi:hypothetical protein
MNFTVGCLRSGGSSVWMPCWRPCRDYMANDELLMTNAYLDVFVSLGFGLLSIFLRATECFDPK